MRAGGDVADDAGDVRAVAVLVAAARALALAPVKSRLSATRLRDVRMPRVDAGVDHRHADAAAGEAAKSLGRALPHLIGADGLRP